MIKTAGEDNEWHEVVLYKGENQSELSAARKIRDEISSELNKYMDTEERLIIEITSVRENIIAAVNEKRYEECSYLQTQMTSNKEQMTETRELIEEAEKKMQEKVEEIEEMETRALEKMIECDHCHQDCNSKRRMPKLLTGCKHLLCLECCKEEFSKFNLKLKCPLCLRGTKVPEKNVKHLQSPDFIVQKVPKTEIAKDESRYVEVYYFISNDEVIFRLGKAKCYAVRRSLFGFGSLQVKEVKDVKFSKADGKLVLYAYNPHTISDMITNFRNNDCNISETFETKVNERMVNEPGLTLQFLLLARKTPKPYDEDYRLGKREKEKFIRTAVAKVSDGIRALFFYDRTITSLEAFCVLAKQKRNEIERYKLRGDDGKIHVYKREDDKFPKKFPVNLKYGNDK